MTLQRTPLLVTCLEQLEKEKASQPLGPAEHQRSVMQQRHVQPQDIHAEFKKKQQQQQQQQKQRSLLRRPVGKYAMKPRTPNPVHKLPPK